MALRLLLAFAGLLLCLTGSVYADAGDLPPKYQWVAIQDVFDDGSILSSYSAYFATRT